MTESEWTLETLKTHFEALLAAEVELRRARREDDQRAIEKAQAATDRRFEAANEWRGQSADRERSQMAQTQMLLGTFLPRETFDATVKEWTAWRGVVNDDMSARHGRQSGISVSAGVLVAALSAVAVVISTVIVLANILTGH